MSVRGQKPTPANLRLVTGYLKKKNLPIAKDKLEVVEKLYPPVWLGKEARHFWEAEAENLQRLGILTETDVRAFAVLCQSYGEWQDAEAVLAEHSKKDPIYKGLMVVTARGVVKTNPLLIATRTAKSIFLKMMLEFGMTPSSRARVKADVSIVNVNAADYFT